MSTQKIIKIGNSLGLILPSKYINALSLKVGDSIKLSLDSNQITLLVEDSHQLSLLQSAKSNSKNNQDI